MSTGLREDRADAFIVWRGRQDPGELVKNLEQQNTSLVFPEDKAYPQNFLEMHDAPERLFVRGALTDLPTISLVGTRRATSYGSACVQHLVPPCVQAGFATVSGFALGIDGLVHQATLDARGITIGILASGIDDTTLYPRAHVQLAQKVLEHDGALVSEFPPGTKARREYFPMRNRLIAGYSKATVVIEATEKSGSLITAKLALEENREVLAVPGPIWQTSLIGCHRLITMGARPCTRAQDIFDALKFDPSAIVQRTHDSLPLDLQERELLEKLREPQHTNTLATMLHLDAQTIGSQLALLELKGLIKTTGGQTWMRC